MQLKMIGELDCNSTTRVAQTPLTVKKAQALGANGLEDLHKEELDEPDAFVLLANAVDFV